MLEEFADCSEEEDKESDDADCRYPFIDEEETALTKMTTAMINLWEKIVYAPF